MAQIVLGETYDKSSGDVNPPYFTTGNYIVKIDQIREHEGQNGLKVIANSTILHSEGAGALSAGIQAGQVVTPKANTGWEGDLKNLGGAVWETWRRLAQSEPMRSQLVGAIRGLAPRDPRIGAQEVEPLVQILCYGRVLSPAEYPAAQAGQLQPSRVEVAKLPRAAVYFLFGPSNPAQGVDLHLVATVRPQKKDRSKDFTDHDWSPLEEADLAKLRSLAQPQQQPQQ